MATISTTDALDCPHAAWCVADHTGDQEGDHVCSSDDRVLFTGHEGTSVSARLVRFRTGGGPYDGSYVAMEHGDLDSLLITSDELRALIERLEALERQLEPGTDAGPLGACRADPGNAGPRHTLVAKSEGVPCP
jgi:hypothetical protein